MGSDQSVPLTPEEAAAALEEARRIGRGGWRLMSQSNRLSLIWFGVAWMVGYAAAQVLPYALGWGVAGLAITGAAVLQRFGQRWDPAPATTGWERQVRRSWWVVVVGTFVLNLVAAPSPLPVYLLLPGALWGLAMLLYALLVRDLPLALLGAGIALLAGVVRTFLLPESLLVFGVVAGGAMAGLGLVRVIGTAGAERQ